MEYLGGLYNLEGAVAFVTGASGGVGKATSLALAKCGADVVVTDIDTRDATAAAEGLCKKIRELGRNAVHTVCDVRDRVSVDEAMRFADKQFGRLNVLIANAGILGEQQMPQELTEDNWRNVFATNVDGVFHCARAAYPLLKAGAAAGPSLPRSKVVVMSSVAALTGYGPQTAYCASKGALIPLTKSLALAWAHDGINVNAVLPGAANTPFTRRVLDSPQKLAYILDRIPLKRLAEAEDIVGPIVFYSSRASDYCTGSTLVVDGGGTSRAMAQ